MKKSFISIAIVAAVISVGIWVKTSGILLPSEKIYVAVEGEGKIAVIDAAKKKVVKTIDLSVSHEGGRLLFLPHNVQVSPDQKSVWVTANIGGHDAHASSFISEALAHGEENGKALGGSDEIIVINPKTDRITARVALGPGLHLAHVVLAPDSAYALVTAQKGEAIYKINARTFKVEKKIIVPSGSEPHGLRISPDSRFAYIALLEGKGLRVLDLANEILTTVPLNGKAVQTGVTPNGEFVTISLYDSRQLAIYQTGTKSVSYVTLPASSRGPIQMYPTPDSRFVYVADQGYYFGQPTSDWVYKIDLTSKSVVKEIKAGSAPHGIVVSADGRLVYVTNLRSNDVSLIDTAIDREIIRIPVGREPNGISIWNK